MASKPTAVCDECGSLFSPETSRMASLCPECAHRLYGYENCAHEMRDGHCAKCGWDGSVSDYFPPRKGGY